MRIAMTADEFYPAIGGAPTYTRVLATELARLGAEPVVITHAYPDQPKEEKIEGVEIRRLDGFVVPRLNRGASIDLFYRLHQCIKYGNFDIVHAQDVYSLMSLISIHSAKRCEIPSVVKCGSVHKSVGLWKLIYQPVISTLRNTNCVIAISRAAERFCHKLGVPQDKTVVILNGVDQSKFNPNVDGSSFRKLVGIEGEPLVATAIRLIKRKGPGYLVAAFARALKEIPNAKLVIAGWGPEIKNLETQAEKLDIEKSVFIVGTLPHDQVAELMAAADVFVLLSTIEALARAAIEALAVGAPLVCPLAGGMPEIIENGFNGLMFQPKDEDSLADAILYVLKDERLAKRLRKNGIKTGRKFSSMTTGKHTLELFEKICEEHA